MVENSMKEPKGITVSKKSWYVEIKGMTIKRAKQSPLIQKIQQSWDKHYVAPASIGRELVIHENVKDGGKMYKFLFHSEKEKRVFNTAVFWGNGYK